MDIKKLMMISNFHPVDLDYLVDLVDQADQVVPHYLIPNYIVLLQCNRINERVKIICNKM